MYIAQCQIGTGTSCKEKFNKENFQTGFVVAGGGFLSFWNRQLIKFEEEKIFGLHKQFCNNEKREINTFENFSCRISLCRKITSEIPNCCINIEGCDFGES